MILMGSYQLRVFCDSVIHCGQDCSYWGSCHPDLSLKQQPCCWELFPCTSFLRADITDGRLLGHRLWFGASGWVFLEKGINGG